MLNKKCYLFICKNYKQFIREHFFKVNPKPFVSVCVCVCVCVCVFFGLNFSAEKLIIY